MRKLATGVVAVLCLGGLGGCSKPAPVTKAEYVAAANDLCSASMKQEVDLVTTWVQDNPDDIGPDGTERFVRFTLVKHLHNTMNALRGIPVPSGDAAYLGSMYQDYDHAVDILFSDPLGNDSDGAEQAAEARFRSYGLGKCASLAADADKDISRKLADAHALAREKAKRKKADATADASTSTASPSD